MTNRSQDRTDIANLLAQLRNEAEHFPLDKRQIALEHVQELENHAAANTLHTERAKSRLKALEVFEPFVPILERIAESLSSVGM
jgi:hypothetical protein